MARNKTVLPPGAQKLTLGEFLDGKYADAEIALQDYLEDAFGESYSPSNLMETGLFFTKDGELCFQHIMAIGYGDTGESTLHWNKAKDEWDIGDAYIPDTAPVIGPATTATENYRRAVGRVTRS